MTDLLLPTIILFYDKNDPEILAIFENVKVALSDKAVFVKLNVKGNPASFATFNVREIPTIVSFLNGKELWRFSGEFSEGMILENFAIGSL
jgi:thioredoxin-like negative regulator of GroEL